MMKPNRYFALDPQGGPAFIYTDSANGHSGTFYAHCLAACANVGNWFEFKLFEQSIGKPALAFAPNGQPRFAASYYVPDDPQYNVPLWKLLYRGCYDNCDNLGQSVWDGVFIYPTIGNGSFSLRIDTNGWPRIALYPTQADLSQMQPGYLYYVWCDNAACLNAGDWNPVSMGTPLFYGDGIDLVLDPANRPRLAYQMGDDGLGYAWCNGNCGIASSWQSRAVESTGQLWPNIRLACPNIKAAQLGCVLLSRTESNISWLYDKTGGSVPAVMFFHYMSNVLIGAAMVLIFSGTDKTMYYILFVTCACLVALALAWKSQFKLGWSGAKI